MTIKLPDPSGPDLFICRRGTKRQCSVVGCTNYEEALCDWPLKDGARTCDRPLCRQHRYHPGGRENLDYCPPHRRLYEEGRDGRAASPPTK